MTRIWVSDQQVQNVYIIFLSTLIADNIFEKFCEVLPFGYTFSIS